MYCRNCGNEVSPQQRFCPKCGNEILITVQPPQGEHPSGTDWPLPKNKRRWPKVVGIACLALAVVFLVVLVVHLFIPKGVWVITKNSIQAVWDAGEKTTDQVSYWIYDEHGNLQSGSTESKTITMGEDGTTEFNYKASDEYTNDDKGRCVTNTGQANYSSTSESPYTSTFIESYTWEEDDSGRTIAMHSMFDGRPDSSCSYVYNKQGFIETSVFDTNGGSETTNYYNKEGNLIRIVYKTDDGTQETTFTYHYNLLHHMKSCTIKAINLDTGKTIRESEEIYTFDNHGNLINENESSTYYEDDGLTQHVERIYTYEYEYIKEPSPWLSQLDHLNFGKSRLY